MDIQKLGLRELKKLKSEVDDRIADLSYEKAGEGAKQVYRIFLKLIGKENLKDNPKRIKLIGRQLLEIQADMPGDPGRNKIIIAIAVILMKVHEWMGDDNMQRHLKIETLFRSSNFLRYVEDVNVEYVNVAKATLQAYEIEDRREKST